MLISKQALAAAMQATTDDNSRYFLHAMQLEPNGTVVATNGHILIMAKDQQDFTDEDFPVVPGAPFHGTPEQPILLDVVIAKRLIAAMPKRSTIPALHTIQVSQNGTPQMATVAATDMQAPMVATITADDDRRFPDYKRVIPAESDDRPVVNVCMAVDVLEAMIKAAKATGQKNPKITMQIPIGEKESPKGNLASALTFKVAGSPDLDVHGVAMPCRI